MSLRPAWTASQKAISKSKQQQPQSSFLNPLTLPKSYLRINKKIYIWYSMLILLRYLITPIQLSNAK